MHVCALRSARLAALAGFISVAAFSGQALAGTATLSIDSTLSVLEMVGLADLTSSGLGILPLGPQGDFAALGAPVTPGFSGGTRSQYTGTIQLKVKPAVQTIQFLGGSSVDANISGDWGPVSGGGPAGQLLTTLSHAPADYGLSLSGLVWAALRGFVMDTNSGVLPYDGAGDFPADVNLPVSAGDLAYTDTLGGAFVTPGGSDLTGLGLVSTSALAGNGNVSIVGNLVTLNLPVNIVQTVDVAGTPVDLLFSGRIVASGTLIPEPSSIVLAGLGCLSLVGLAIRRRRA